MRIILLIILLAFNLQGCKKSIYTYQGYINYDNIYLSSPFAGKLKSLLIERGRFVKKGDLLFVLDLEPETFSLDEMKDQLLQNQSTLADLEKPKREPRIDALKAQIAQIEAQIALAELRVRRNQTLYNRKVLAKDKLDEAKEYLHVLEAKKDQAAANLDLARLGARVDVINAQKSKINTYKNKLKALAWNVSQKSVYAADNGYIHDTYYVEGEYVESSRPVVSLISRKNIYIEFFVPYSEMKNIALGKRVQYFYMDNDKDKYNAEISYVSSEAEYLPPLVYSKNNMDKIVFKVKAKALEMNELLPGLPITINIDANHG